MLFIGAISMHNHFNAKYLSSKSPHVCLGCLSFNRFLLTGLIDFSDYLLPPFGCFKDQLGASVFMLILCGKLYLLTRHMELCYKHVSATIFDAQSKPAAGMEHVITSPDKLKIPSHKGTCWGRKNDLFCVLESIKPFLWQVYIQINALKKVWVAQEFMEQLFKGHWPG